MGWSYAAMIATMHQEHDYAQSQLSQGRTDYNSAQAYWSQPDDHACLDKLMDAWYHTNQACENIIHGGFYGYNGSTNMIPTALDLNMACNFIDEAPEFELTMSDIINTLLAATPDEVLYVVGLLDAYRQSVWNRPFNEEMFAALARGFMP